MWVNKKKRLRRRRKRIKRNSFRPRIIVDTNIWYQLGQNEDDLQMNRDLTPTYVNLWEFSVTGLNVRDPIKVRNAIRKAMQCSKNRIFLRPMQYLIKRANKKYKILKDRKTDDMMRFTQMIANGYTMNEIQAKDYYKYVSEEKSGVDKICLSMNENASCCKRKIKDLKKHRSKISWPIIVQLLNTMALQATGGVFDLSKLPLREYELLVFVMDCYYKKLEVGERKFERNDFWDLFILAYVRRGDKFWTNDNKWIRLIHEIGFEHYLYNPI